MSKRHLVTFAVAAAGVGFVVMQNLMTASGPSSQPVVFEPVTPNWASIAAWPATDSDTVDASPDPNRRITAIVLDDSGSMGDDIVPAKLAVVQSVAAMNPDDRVAVIALNAGVILPFTTVSDAEAPLRDALIPVISDGRTPLTSAVASAKQLLEDEAAMARSFGTYRVIVTTDGAADDGEALIALVEHLAETTPIQIATIGIGIEGGHVLRRDDLGSFVDVSNIDALQAALQDAVAENTSFDAVTSFEEGN